MNRKLRRAAASGKAGQGERLQQALTALEKVQELSGAVQSLHEVKEQVAEAHKLVMALVDDYQNLADELALERRVFVRVLAMLRVTRIPGPVELHEPDELARIDMECVIDQVRAELAGDEPT